MRNVLAATALALAASGVLADQFIEGNWYTDEETHSVQYDFTPKGSYMKTTSMNGETGECTQEEKQYDSPIGPFAEEVALVLRGPIRCKKFAAYFPGSAPQKVKRSHVGAHQHGHGHQHFHKRHEEARQVQARSVGALVTATINGQAVTFTNEYDGGAGSTPTTSASAPDSSDSGSSDSDDTPPPPAPADDSSSDDSSSSDDAGDDTPPASGDWVRTAFYDADSQTSEGLAFLNNRGYFDYKFGNGLSYASSDAKTKADSPQILEKDLEIPSGTEVVIFSDEKCTEDTCDYWRPNTVAHRGFEGAEKAFLFEFQMPSDGKKGAREEAPDMPAIWMLNANILRTGQYLSPKCMCWKSGCGEFDLFEVLDPGNFRCKSTVHAKDGIGHPDWFRRPVDKTMKAAVVFTGGKGYIKVLDDNADFPSAFSSADLQGLID